MNVWKVLAKVSDITARAVGDTAEPAASDGNVLMRLYPTKSMDKARMVPVFLTPDRGRLVVIFGGGPVALRKARQFAGYRLRVVAAEILPELKALADETVTARFDPAALGPYFAGAFIAVAATDRPELNAAVTEAAEKAGLLANSAHGGGDLLLPSVVRKEKYTVAVSSEGHAPAFPPYVAEQIDRFLGPEYDRMLDLLIDLRQEVRTEIASQPDRAAFLAAVLHSEEVWTLLQADDRNSAHRLARQLGHLPE